MKKGADKNAKDKYKNTALMIAAGNGHEEVVKLLLEKGADINAENRDGKNALMFAAENRHKEIVELIKRYVK